MDLLQFLIVIILVAAALYILSLLPIDKTLAQIARVIILVAFAIWALTWLFSMLPALWPHHR